MPLGESAVSPRACGGSGADVLIDLSSRQGAHTGCTPNPGPLRGAQRGEVCFPAPETSSLLVSYGSLGRKQPWFGVYDRRFCSLCSALPKCRKSEHPRTGWREGAASQVTC